MVLITGSPFELTSFGRTGANDGEMRVPGPGNAGSAADERMTIQSEPPPVLRGEGFAGRVKLPVNVAPAVSSMIVPGAAPSIAA